MLCYPVTTQVMRMENALSWRGIAMEAIGDTPVDQRFSNVFFVC